MTVKKNKRNGKKKKSTRSKMKTFSIPNMLRISPMKFVKHPLGMSRAAYAQSVESILPFDKASLWKLEASKIAQNSRPWSIYSYKLN